MKYKILLTLIIFLGFFLRFWLLGNNPASLDWDEASLGYNAYSILKTGKDEYGNFLPFSIRSFNDYKPPLYVYLSVVPIWIFGLTEFSTRFISAALGSLSVVVVFLLIKELFPLSSNRLRFLTTFLFAVSPWHLQFSRVAFEANAALFFFLVGILFHFKGFKKGIYFFVSFTSFAFSLYSYHSPRLVVPFILLGLLVLYFRQTRLNAKAYILSALLFAFLAFPIVRQLQSSTEARFSSVTILKPTERLKQSILLMQSDYVGSDSIGSLMHNRRIIFAREILAGYLDHFNFDFLFLTGDAAGRHHPVGMGMLYAWEFPFLLAGIFYLIKSKQKSSYFVFWWFLSAPLASSVTEATPHAVRSLLFLPTFQILSAAGVLFFISFIRKLTHKKLYYVFILSVFIVNFYYYLHTYWILTPIEYASWWQYGYKEMVEEVNKIKDQYQKVLVTYQYDQPYVYFLFYTRYDPLSYQNQWNGQEILRAQRSFDKYEFRNIDWEKDAKSINTLLVGTPKEIPSDAAGLMKDINFPDGSVAFRLVAR